MYLGEYLPLECDDGLLEVASAECGTFFMLIYPEVCQYVSQG